MSTERSLSNGITRPLTEKQADRRRRVLVAAIDLAADGGYEGVQMRAVADRADVALGTVYHYFTSKDHLLAESLNEWLRGLEESVARRPAVGDSTLDRVLDLLRRTTRGMQENEKVSAALIGGLVAEGEQVAACQEALHESFARMMGTAFPLDFPADRRAKIIRSLEHIWFSELIGWKNGWNPYDRSVQELEDAAELFLGDYD
jgi:AcrR family transcriptional regulator